LSLQKNKRRPPSTNKRRGNSTHSLITTTIFDSETKQGRSNPERKRASRTGGKQKSQTTPKQFTAEDYFLEDYRHTLFPLSTTQFLVERFSKELREYVRDNPFRPQTRCSAAKRGFHIRRTVKLDPPSELFIYDLAFRNRKQFRGDHTPARSSFGFLFPGGKPVSSKVAYQAYREKVTEAKNKYKYGIRFDISCYFNSLYHHDLVNRFREIGAPEADVDIYGRFLREINSGRSLDCLPHGLHPCKVLGADFLKFVDNSMRLKSPLFVRFLDDFNLFADDEQKLHADFVAIQELLSEKGLFLNEKKTVYADDFGRSMTEEIGEIKKALLQARHKVAEPSGIELSDLFAEWDEEDDEGDSDVESAAAEDELEFTDILDEEQIEYLLQLLNDPDVDESDAELALVLLRDHGDEVIAKMQSFLVKFPSLTRTIYQFCPYVEDKAELCNLVLVFLRGEQLVTEYQLFWITKLLEDYLSAEPCYGSALALLNSHPSSTRITQAKLLEIPEHRFGMPDLREQALRSGQCDWPAWAAAVGCRKEKAAHRNQLLGYFQNGGPMNNLIGSCVKTL
jgi:hypothetical protein